MHIAYSLTSKQYPQRPFEGPVDIAEGRSGLVSGSGAGEEQGKTGKAIELNDMSNE